MPPILEKLPPGETVETAFVQLVAVRVVLDQLAKRWPQHAGRNLAEASTLNLAKLIEESTWTVGGKAVCSLSLVEKFHELDATIARAMWESERLHAGTVLAVLFLVAEAVRPFLNPALWDGSWPESERAAQGKEPA